MWKERHYHFSSVFLQRIAVRLWCEWALWWNVEFHIIRNLHYHSWPLSWDHYTPSLACGGYSNLVEFTQGVSRFLLFKENETRNCYLCHAKSSVWLCYACWHIHTFDEVLESDRMSEGWCRVNKTMLAVGKLQSTSFTSLPNYCWILKYTDICSPLNGCC